MSIDQVTNVDALPVLERMIQFAGARQRIIAHNIANLSTPNYQAVDVDVEAFQAQLAEAVDNRREKYGGHRGALQLESRRQVRPRDDGGLELTPQAAGAGILFHDRNNRDLERHMQALAENVAAFRVASELYRQHLEQIHSAIRLTP